MLKGNDRQIFIKLAEKCNELAAGACKGANDNICSDKLEREIAHVRVYIDETVERFSLDKKNIQKEYKNRLESGR